MRTSIIGTALYFQQRVRVLPSGCVAWTGTLDRDGYGQAVIGYKGPGRPITGRAHRILYEMWLGKIPDGLQLDHLCRNRACVNPLHLDPVTSKENVRRGLLPLIMRDPLRNPRPKRNPIKVCKNGHLMRGDNVGVSKKGRWCRACHREHMRKFRAKK